MNWEQSRKYQKNIAQTLERNIVQFVISPVKIGQNDFFSLEKSRI